MFVCFASEWVEFTPYEIGMDKYGTFMKTELFGSKFFCGKLIEKFPESPLYYLQGMACQHDLCQIMAGNF